MTLLLLFGTPVRESTAAPSVTAQLVAAGLGQGYGQAPLAATATLGPSASAEGYGQASLAVAATLGPAGHAAGYGQAALAVLVDLDPLGDAEAVVSTAFMVTAQLVPQATSASFAQAVAAVLLQPTIAVYFAYDPTAPIVALGPRPRGAVEVGRRALAEVAIDP